jgi:hypothetical protein
LGTFKGCSSLAFMVIQLGVVVHSLFMVLQLGVHGLESPQSPGFFPHGFPGLSGNAPGPLHIWTEHCTSHFDLSVVVVAPAPCCEPTDLTYRSHLWLLPLPPWRSSRWSSTYQTISRAQPSARARHRSPRPACAGRQGRVSILYIIICPCLRSAVGTISLHKYIPPTFAAAPH